MQLRVLVSFLFFASCLCDDNIISNSLTSNDGGFNGLEILSSGPCGLDLSIELSSQCHHDFTLYTKAICDPQIIPRPLQNQTSTLEFWAYKSKTSQKVS